MEWYPSVGHQPRAGAGVRRDRAGAEPVGLRRAGICRQTGRGDGLGARDNGLSGTGPPRHGALASASGLRQRAAGRPLRWGGGRRRLGSVRASPVPHRRPERISDLIKAIPSESRTAHVEKLRHAAGLASPTRHSAALPTLLSPLGFSPPFLPAVLHFPAAPDPPQPGDAPRVRDQSAAGGKTNPLLLLQQRYGSRSAFLRRSFEPALVQSSF